MQVQGMFYCFLCIMDGNAVGVAVLSSSNCFSRTIRTGSYIVILRSTPNL